MSLFSKSPKDGPPKPDSSTTKIPAPARGAGPRPQYPPAAPVQPPAAAPKPALPAVVPTRIIDGAAAARARPAMPVIATGPPGAPPAATPSAATALPSADAVPSGLFPMPAAAPKAQPPLPPAARSEGAPLGSVRPTAPDLARQEGAQVSIADTFERLLSLEDLDEGFAKIQGSSDASRSSAPALTDLAEVRSLFAQLAVNHVRQVRDFMIDLRWRDATLEWVGICEPALRSLRRAADKLELRELCGALDRFAEALAVAQGTGGGPIDGERRDNLLARYDELSAVLPQAFALDLDRTQREAVILQSLLLQVPEVKKVTLDKLYAAGLTTLEALFLATPADIVATTGIDEGLAARIVDRFRTYREQVKAAAPDATRANERERVAQLTARLRREHDECERLAQSWTREAEQKRKSLRKTRAQTLLDLQVVLARLGEVDRLKELERLPFERKVAHLESFLEEAREKYMAQS
jgi:DNA repair protein RadA